MADYSAMKTDWKWGGTTIANVISFSGIGATHPTIDTTDLADTAAQKVARGFYEGPEVSLQAHFDPADAGQVACVADVQTGTTRVLAVTWPDVGTTDYTCNAICTGFTPSGSLGDPLIVDITFAPHGTITLA